MIPWSFENPFPLSGMWTVEESFRYCFRMTVSHYENFPVIGAIAGRDRRRALSAVYCFARIADDFADLPCYEGMRLRLLDGWEEQLDACYSHNSFNGSLHPVFVALRHAVSQFSIPREHLSALISAFRQDCLKTRYDTMEEVFDYCKRSANPVGRIVLRVLDKDSEELCRLSDKICTSLQLINFWQDISIDRVRDRIYIPVSFARKWGVSIDSVVRGKSSGRFRRLMEELTTIAENLMIEGSELAEKIGFPHSLYINGVVNGGLIVLKRTRQLGEQILFSRPLLGLMDVVAIGGKTVYGSVIGGIKPRLFNRNSSEG